jgi:hypothetical protein
LKISKNLELMKPKKVPKIAIKAGSYFHHFKNKKSVDYL